jgi:hypothetical protein
MSSFGLMELHLRYIMFANADSESEPTNGYVENQTLSFH